MRCQWTLLIWSKKTTEEEEEDDDEEEGVIRVFSFSFSRKLFQSFFHLPLDSEVAHIIMFYMDVGIYTKENFIAS